jgi:hypothetical protein
MDVPGASTPDEVRGGGAEGDERRLRLVYDRAMPKILAGNLVEDVGEVGEGWDVTWLSGAVDEEGVKLFRMRIYG